MRHQVEVSVDRGAAEHPPGLYRFDRPASGVQGFDDVNDEAIERFRSEGYLVIERAFTPAEVEDALVAISDLIGGKHPEFRGMQLEAAARERWPELSDLERQDAVRKLMAFVRYDSRLDALAHHPRLRDLLTRIMGEPPELFQDMALLKPPRIGREKPWHQDNAYFDLPLGTQVVGVWIALDPATAENGCMHVIPGSHRDGPVVHFQRRDWQICDRDVAVGRDTFVELAPGGCLIFDGMIHHGTPPNRSPLRRRALQFHYKPASVQWTSREERLAIFGSEGKDVTC